jgi:glucosamine--fructose-6-phosphate aminotransferase (isomerizing)
MGHKPYKCYDEIVTQADAWQQAVDEVSQKTHLIKQFFHHHQPKDILIVGCGSPFYMGESINLYWQKILAVRCGVAPASELVLYPDSYLSKKENSTVLVVVSRSGATTETIWAAETFQKRYQGRTLLITCAPDSPLEKLADLSIFIPDGYEETVPQTRSFAMYLAAQLIGALVANDDDVISALHGAPRHADRIINAWADLAEDIAEQDTNHAFYMGSGPLYGIAREGSLKMTEMSITTCSAHQFMEARHGPRSIIDEYTLLTGLFGNTATEHESKVMADFVGTSTPISVALTPTPDWKTGNARYHIPVNVIWPDAIQGLAYLPVMHLMAYHRAVVKDVNPDESRHLSIYVDLN